MPLLSHPDVSTVKEMFLLYAKWTLLSLLAAVKNASSCNFYSNFRGKQLCHFSGFTDVVRIINSERKKGLCLLVFSLMKYTLSASSCSFPSAVSSPLLPPHLCFSLCDPARRPHRPSALLDVWELGRRRALRSGRDGWENVCESGGWVRMKGCGRRGANHRWAPLTAHGSSYWERKWHHYNVYLQVRRGPGAKSKAN